MFISAPLVLAGVVMGSIKFQLSPWSTERRTPTGKPVVSDFKAGSKRTVPSLVTTMLISNVGKPVAVVQGIGALSRLSVRTLTPPA